VDPTIDPAVREAARVGLEKVRELRWQALIPPRFVHASLTDFTDEVAGALAEWTAQPRGRNLVILGPVGTGKSHAAVDAVRDAAVVLRLTGPDRRRRQRA
jgi:hypothetical protein